jgi:Fur family ferric uptake transcriptional regulator|tara:strand:+ start:2274 stop:2774 length:501 start_codon:yes stop_codon:yes gene_type:complete
VITSPNPSLFVQLFGRYLRENRLPVTPQREAVARTVFGSDEHLSVEEIVDLVRKEGAGAGKATVYRTLELLVKSELVAEHDFGEGFKRYEHRLSSEPNHDHLICINCARVVEFKNPDLDTVEKSLAKTHGFYITKHKLEMYGLCLECVNAGTEIDQDGITCPIDTL